MRQTAVKTGFGVLLVSLIYLPCIAWAAPDTSDPNAALRKSMNPTATGNAASALLDLEKVQKKNNELAVDHFTKMIAQNPKDAASYARRGKAYSGLKDYDKALEDTDKAIVLDPKLAEAYMTRAVIHFVKNDYEASWEDVHKVESNGSQMWPSFMEALKEKSGRTK